MIEDVLYINADLFFTVLNKFSLNREAPHDVEGVPSQLNLIFTNNKWKCFSYRIFAAYSLFLWCNLSLNVDDHVDDGGDHGDGDGDGSDHDHDGDDHESWVMMVVLIMIVTW